MANMDEQLVRQVVEQVLAKLQQADKPSQGKRQASASFQPAMGICTGDYSKFPELAGRLHSQGRTAAPPPADAAEGQNNPTPALSGIVTAQQIQEAMSAADDGVVLLAADARPTPLANDLIRQSPQKVRRLSRTADQQGQASASGAAQLPWLIWADGHCPHVQKITSQLSSRLRPSAASRNDSGLLQVVGDLQRQVAGGALAGGLLFVRSAAQAVCYANRCRALRAAVGTCDQAVEQAVNNLGVNVLVVEYPYVSGDAMWAMTHRMLDQTPHVPGHVRRHLSELEGS